MGRVLPPLVGIALVGLGLYVHRATVGYALLGYDTYPQIATSRCQNVSDFLDTFREPIADGYLGAKFFRPVLSLLLAADYALWGLDPYGYHLTSLAVFGTCIALLFVTTRRLLCTRAILGPAIGTLFFALHPSVLEVIPIPARRSELLVIAFFLATLYVLPVGDERVRNRSLMAGVLVWLASGTKEFGLTAVGLVFVHQMLFTNREGIRPRLVRAGKAVIPAVVGASIYVANHLAVIGRIGGYSQPPTEGYLERLAQVLAKLPGVVFCRSPVSQGWSAAACAGVSVLLLTLIVVCYFAWGIRSTHRIRRAVAGAILLGVVWTAATTLFIGLSTEYRMYYALVPAVGVAVMVGASAHRIVLDTGAGAWDRVSGIVAGIGLVVVVCMALWASPLHTEYDDCQTMSQRVNATLAKLSTRIEQAAGREETFRFPFGREKGEAAGPRRKVGVPFMVYYTIQAWADLKYPDKHVLVVRSKQAQGRHNALRVTVWNDAHARPE